MASEFLLIYGAVFAAGAALLFVIVVALAGVPLSLLDAVAYRYWPVYRAWGIQERAKRKMLDVLRSRAEAANEGDWFARRVEATAEQMLNKPAFSDCIY